MLLHTSHSLLLVFFIYILGFCSAFPPKIRYVVAPPDENGIRIIAASCGNNHYTKQQIYNALEAGKAFISPLKHNVNIEDFTYPLEPYEAIPFQGPYFYHFIDNGTQKKQDQAQIDLVIFTKQGQLAKVKSNVQIYEGIRQRGTWELEDCLLDYELIPATTPEWKLK